MKNAKVDRGGNPLGLGCAGDFPLPPPSVYSESERHIEYLKLLVRNLESYLGGSMLPAVSVVAEGGSVSSLGNARITTDLGVVSARLSDINEKLLQVQRIVQEHTV